MHHKKTKRVESCKARLALGRLPGNLPVVYLVTQDGIWGTGSDDVGLIQSTKAPMTSFLQDLRRGEVFASVGLRQDLKDLKVTKDPKDV